MNNEKLSSEYLTIFLPPAVHIKIKYFNVLKNVFPNKYSRLR